MCECLLSLQNVGKVYESDKQHIQALDDISVDIESGSVTGILGPNGAGKTTLIKCILGLVEPSEGTISINGNVQNGGGLSRQSVAMVLEGSRNLYWRLSVLENMRFFSALSGNNPKKQIEYFKQLLDRFNFTYKRDAPVRELSRGQKQKSSILCALARKPEILFLDEPTLGLDIENSNLLRQELNKMASDRGYTIIISSHDMTTVQSTCDEVIILIDGRIEISSSIGELLDTFNLQTYEATVVNQLSLVQKQRLERTIGARKFREHRSGTRFEFETTSNEFFNDISQLKSLNTSIEKLSAIEANMEDIFLDYISERNTQEGVKNV